MKHLDKAFIISSALVLGSLCAPFPSMAEAGSNPLANAQGSQLVGVWTVTVEVHNCNTHALLNTFPAMHKYELGGTGQLLPAGSSPAIPVHMVVWEYLGDDTYSSTARFFRYDANGLAGVNMLRSEVWVSEDGNEYGGSGVAEVYDLNGNLLGTPGCPEFSGTRFTGDS